MPTLAVMVSNHTLEVERVVTSVSKESKMSGGHVMTVYAQCISLWQEGSWLRRLAPPEERHCFYGVTLCSTRKTMALLECSMIAWNAQRLELINEAASENYPHCGYACILLDQNTKICMCFSSCACFFFNLKDQLQKKNYDHILKLGDGPRSPIIRGGWVISQSYFLSFLASTPPSTQFQVW